MTQANLHLPRGFRFAGIHGGIKVQRKDLALIASAAPAAAAVVCTRNQLRASCVDRTARLLPSQEVHAVVVGSGNANCLSGPQESTDDERMAAAVAQALDVPSAGVLTASTGGIGKPLPIERIEAAAPALAAALEDDPTAAAEAIRTTDKTLKLASRELVIDGVPVRILGLAKGSGMIHPDMATMLGFLCTDARCAPDDLAQILRRAIKPTFNQITVDRDTSTNDMALLLANGQAEVEVDASNAPFAEAVQAVCAELARAIAADGEGATRMIEVRVEGAPDVESASVLARSIVESNLFKCSLFGNSSGWSRALAAVGARASTLGIVLERERVRVVVEDVVLFEAGQPTGARVDVSLPRVHYRIELGLGEGGAVAWGCDLSYDYVSINAVTKADPLETHSPGLKRRLLVECLNYTRRFHGKLAVIKYGGAAMLREVLKDAFAEDLVLLKAAGLQPVVVHGGGPEISRTLDRLGEKTHFEDGIRVTDETSIKIVEMVLTGKVNTDVVTRINTRGGHAIGLSGKDDNLLTARKLEVEGREYGQVGEVAEVRTEVITMLLDGGFIPVISPIGVDAHGATYNINADTVAAEVAKALDAEKLIFLTDVAGILDGDSKVSQATPEELEGLIERGVVSGGMLPKVRAMLAALEGGVRSAHIIDGRVPHNLLAELYTDKGVGTWIHGRP